MLCWIEAIKKQVHLKRAAMFLQWPTMDKSLQSAFCILCFYNWKSKKKTMTLGAPRKLLSFCLRRVYHLLLTLAFFFPQLPWIFYFLFKQNATLYANEMLQYSLTTYPPSWGAFHDRSNCLLVGGWHNTQKRSYIVRVCFKSCFLKQLLYNDVINNNIMIYFPTIII